MMIYERMKYHLNQPIFSMLENWFETFNKLFRLAIFPLYSINEIVVWLNVSSRNFLFFINYISFENWVAQNGSNVAETPWIHVLHLRVHFFFAQLQQRMFYSQPLNWYFFTFFFRKKNTVFDFKFSSMSPLNI